MSKGHPEKRMALFFQVRRRLLITHYSLLISLNQNQLLVELQDFIAWIFYLVFKAEFIFFFRFNGQLPGELLRIIIQFGPVIFTILNFYFFHRGYRELIINCNTDGLLFIVTDHNFILTGIRFITAYELSRPSEIFRVSPALATSKFDLPRKVPSKNRLASPGSRFSSCQSAMRAVKKASGSNLGAA